MSGNDGRVAVGVGVGAAACVACCAGPIVGVLAAIGVTTAIGATLFGLGASVLGALAFAIAVVRRRRRASACAAPAAGPVAVTLSQGAGRT